MEPTEALKSSSSEVFWPLGSTRSGRPAVETTASLVLGRHLVENRETLLSSPSYSLFADCQCPALSDERRAAVHLPSTGRQIPPQEYSVIDWPEGKNGDLGKLIGVFTAMEVTGCRFIARLSAGQ